MFFEIVEVLLVRALIERQLRFSALLVAGSDVRQTQSIASVRQIGVELQRPREFRDGIGIFFLVEIQIAQLQMGLRQLRIEREGLLQKRSDFAGIETGTLSAAAFPEAHGVVILRAGIRGLQLREATEALKHFIRMIRRAIGRARQEEVRTRIGGIQIRGLEERRNGLVILAARIKRHAQANGQAR